MLERARGRSQRLVFCLVLGLVLPVLFATAGKAHAQPGNAEARWRALVDTAKLDDALALARGEVSAEARGSGAYWLASVRVADTLAEKGDRLGARDGYRRILDGAPTGLAEARGQALVGLGYLSLRSGDEMESLAPRVKRARDLLPLEGGTNAALEAAILDAMVRLRQGQPREALGIAQQGALLAQSGGMVRTDYLLRFHALEASAFEAAGDMAKGREQYESTASHAGDPALTPRLKAALWVSLASLAHRFGDEARGLDFARQAVEWISTTYGPDHPSLVAAERARAAIASSLGAGTEAVDAAEDALRITRLGKPSAVELATVENDAGAALMGIGRLTEAEIHLTSAAATLGDAARGALAGTVYGRLGDLALQTGYYQGAKRWLELGQRALAGTGSDVRRALVPVLSHLGELARVSDALDEALSLDGRALSIAMEEYGPDHDEVGRALANVGGAVMGDGRGADAEPLLRRSIEILSARLGPDHIDLAKPRTRLAECLLNEGKPAEAAAELERAFRGEMRRLEALVPRARPDDLRRFLDSTQQTTWIATALALRPDAPPDIASSSLGMVLSRKSLDAEVERARVRAVHAASGNGGADLLARVAAGRVQLARALLQGTPSREHLRGLQADADRLELELSRQAAASASAPAPLRAIDPAEVARALPPGAALVELVLVKPLVQTGQGGIPASDRIAAYVVRPEGPVQVRDMGPVQLLGVRVDLLRKAVQRGEPAREALADAYTAIVGPWAALVDKVDMLFLAPDGPLTLLPFEMLTRPDGKTLLETTHVTYLTSGRDLIDLAQPRPLRRDLGASLLVGDPDYDRPATGARAGAAPGSLLGGVRWPRLPGTAQEVRAIAALLPGAAVRLGVDADDTTLASARGARVVHLATHGFFLDTAGVPAAKSRGLVLDAPDAPHVVETDETIATRARVLDALSDHPEIRSGLVLAGANTSGKTGAGYLTASELETLDLSSADLVVLSACETAVGETTAGLGVTGLRRSLAVAGARSEVMSLWKVDDAATAELMKQFYQNVSGGMGRSDALRGAKLAVRAHPEWSAPYFWAAFQLFGDWRPIVESASSAPAAMMKVTHRAAGCACSSSPGAGAAGSLPLMVLAAPVLFAALRRRKSAAVAVLVVGLLAGPKAARADATASEADALALNQRVAQKIMQGEYAEALALERRALRAEPDNDGFLVNAAALSGTLADRKAARSYYLQAIEQALAVDAHHRAQLYSAKLMELAETESAALLAALAVPTSATSPTETQGTIDVDQQLNEGRASLQQGDLTHAAAAAAKAEAVCQQLLPHDAVRLARARALSGLALAGSGHAEGIPMIEGAIATMSEALGKDHPEVINQRSALANALLSLGRLAESATVLEGVAADSARHFGKDSAYELSVRTNLVDTYAKAGKPREAIALAQRTLEPCRRQLGPHNQFCLQLMKAMAWAEYASGNKGAARQAATRALTDQLRATGAGGSSVLLSTRYAAVPEQPAFVELVALLSMIELGPGAHDDLQAVRARSVILARTLGPEALPTLRNDLVIGQLEVKSGKLDGAVRTLLDLHRRVDRAYGAYSPMALEYAMYASTLLAGVGRFADAEPLAVENSQRVRQMMGVTSEMGIGARYNEGYVKDRLHRPDGPAILKEALAQAVATLGPGSPVVAQMQKQVGVPSP